MKKLLDVLLKVLIFIGVWCVSFVLSLFLFVPESGTITSLVTVFLILVLPVGLAVLAILPWKKFLSKEHKKPDYNHPASHKNEVSPHSTFATQQIPNYHPPLQTNQMQYTTPAFCTYCDAALASNATFCPRCGVRTHVASVINPITPVSSNSYSATNDVSDMVAASVKAIQDDGIKEQPDISDDEDDNITFTAASGKSGKVYHVNGIPYCVDNLLKLGCENSDYNMTKREIVDCFMTDERIYKYTFHGGKVTLLPEPTNVYDPNAIKVIVDGEHVGYIKKGSCKHLLNVIAENRIHSIDCDIGGGPYKYVYENEYEDNKYEMDKVDTNYFVTLHIRELEK